MAKDEQTVQVGPLTISLTDSRNVGPCVLLLHDHSSCKEVFGFLKRYKLYSKYRFITVDLPGHGKSSDALDVSETYSIQGYAHVIRGLITALEIPKLVIVGWSLGGRIAIELMARYTEVVALMVIGTPPHPLLAAREYWSEADVHTYMINVYGPTFLKNKALLSATRRVDGRMRTHIFKDHPKISRPGQHTVPRRQTIPLAVVRGEADDNDDIESFLNTQNTALWGGGIRTISKSGHACFLDNQKGFAHLLADFLLETSSDFISRLDEFVNFSDNFTTESRIYSIGNTDTIVILLKSEWSALLQVCERQGISLIEFFSDFDSDDNPDISEAVSLFLLRYFRSVILDRT